MSRLTAPDLMKRLLAIVPWVAEQDEPVPLEVIAERFAYPLDRLQTDLCEMVPCVGTWPRDPYDLIDLVLDDDGCVSIWYNNHFTAPLRLTPSQAVALVASATAARDSVDDADALTRGVAKLASVLGIDTADAVDIHLGGGDESLRSLLRDAIAKRQVVSLDYYSHGRDTRTHRDIEPLALRAEKGAWYVSAWCRLAQGERRFRLDRMVDGQLTGDVFEHRETTSASGFFADDDATTVTLELPRSARWIVDHAIVREVEEGDETIRVRIPVSAPSWLARLLLQVGAEGRIVAAHGESADAFGPTLGVDAATAVLARYAT